MKTTDSRFPIEQPSGEYEAIPAEKRDDLPDLSTRTEVGIAATTNHALHGSGLRGLIPPLAALMFVGVLYQLMLETLPYDNYLYRLLRLNESWFDQVVPLAILLLFVWTLVDLFLKLIAARASRRALSGTLVGSLAAEVERNGPQAATGILRHLPRKQRQRSIMQRLFSLLEIMSSTREPQRAHDAFKHQAELASVAASDAYSSARTFIWAMPILGFLGTVLGIGLAVGEFSGFLTSDIDDVDLVKEKLSSVAAGLAYAFDTTMLGLLASLPTMLFMAYVQQTESQVNNSFESVGLLLLAKSRGDQEGGDRSIDLTPAYELQRVIEVLIDGQRALGEAMLSSAESNHRLTDRMENAVASTEDLTETVKRLEAKEAELNGQVEDLWGHVARVAPVVEHGVEKLVTSLAVITERLDAAATANQEASRLHTEVSALVAKIDEQISRNESKELLRGLDAIRDEIAELPAAVHAAYPLSGVVDEIVGKFDELRAAQQSVADGLGMLRGPIVLRLDGAEAV